MKIYLTSNIPIATLLETYTSIPPAEFLLDDLIELSKDNESFVINDLEIALGKIKSKKSKFIYEINIKQCLMK